MDDVIEIDLRKVILTLWEKKFWILGFSLLVGAAVFLYFFLQPRNYEATAVIALTKPRYLPNFDPRYQTVPSTAVNNKVVMDIAKSDDITIFVFDSWNDPNKEQDQRRAFRENSLLVKAGSDPTVISLTVRLESAQEAARLANLWADRVVERINTLYSGQDQAQLTFFEVQIAVAEQSLRTAENKLAEFEGRNPARSLQAQLDALLIRQQDLLRRQQLISALQRDARALLSEVANLPGTSALPDEVRTRLLVLQMRQYSDTALFQTETTQSIPAQLQLQLSLATPEQALTAAIFRQSVEQWLASLEEQALEVGALLEEYPAVITPLQQQIEQFTEEKHRLTLEREVAADTYSTLNRKYQEVRITIQDSAGDAKIGSRALPPILPAGRGTLTYTLAALVGAVALAVVFVLTRDWWLQANGTAAKS